jgi:hypothetical protein
MAFSTKALLTSTAPSGMPFWAGALLSLVAFLCRRSALCIPVASIGRRTVALIVGRGRADCDREDGLGLATLRIRGGTPR